MTEKLIGQAKREMIGNDIFWDFHMYDFKMPHLFIDPTCEYVPIGDERFGAPPMPMGVARYGMSCLRWA